MQSAGRQLIVTADDFGLTVGVDRAVIAAHCDGVVTCASLLANGRAFDDAVTQALRHTTLAIGVHVNLTEGPPVSDAASVPSLVGADGHFRRGTAAFATRVATGAVRLDEIELEIRAQIERVLAAGITPAYLDGHQHVQFVPAVFARVVRAATAYGIGALRCACEPPRVRTSVAARGGSWKVRGRQLLVAQGLSLLARGLRPAATRARLAMSDHLFGVALTGLLDTDTLYDVIEALPEGVSELFCHPGECDEALRATPTRLREQRVREARALVEPGLRALIEQRRIGLISYRDLRVVA